MYLIRLGIVFCTGTCIWKIINYGFAFVPPFAQPCKQVNYVITTN